MKDDCYLKKDYWGAKEDLQLPHGYRMLYNTGKLLALPAL